MPVQAKARSNSNRRRSSEFGDGTNQFTDILPKLKKDKDFKKADKEDKENPIEFTQRTTRPPVKKVSVNCKLCGKTEKTTPYDGMREVHICKQCNKKG